MGGGGGGEQGYVTFNTDAFAGKGKQFLQSRLKCIVLHN